jgi:hypothetical protein
MLDMFVILMKSLGLDPQLMTRQVGEVATAFRAMQEAQTEAGAALGRVEANQRAMMTHMGIYVAPPTDDELALIATESTKLLAQHGGVAA